MYQGVTKLFRRCTDSQLSKSKEFGRVVLVQGVLRRTNRTHKFYHLSMISSSRAESLADRPRSLELAVTEQ